MEEAQVLFPRFGAAMVIGILVGLQRQVGRSQGQDEVLAGARTFALMALVGCMAALAADMLDSAWAFVGSVALVGLLLVAAHVVGGLKAPRGLTTEIAALTTTLTGALCYWGYLELAAAIGVATATLLALKIQMHTLAQRITPEDVRATLTFAAISAIILPVLPNQTYGPEPLNVLNPYSIWLMVVFISGISFLGYLLNKLVGARRGLGLTGLLGGMVSSTAVTLSLAQRSLVQPGLGKPFALAVTLAWTMMFGRVLLIVAALNVGLLPLLLPPMLGAAVMGIAWSGYLYLAQRSDQHEDVTLSNPFELWPAIQFGLFYAVILLLSRAAQVYWGQTGVYASSALAGLADVNAITLSMTALARAAGGLDPVTATRAIVLAAIANTLVKGIIVLASGSLALKRATLPGFLLMTAAGAGIAFFVI
ncbi:MAG: MgtC/SapB family protein [Chloroflexi bacterium]|nr:MgtC/SapB family protein [Chloroflexota bacterium]